MKRFAALLLAVPLAAASFAVQAQAWPARPVKFVVPFGAGGPADIYARFLGQRLQEPLGQSFVVENRPGGGSVVGSDYVAKSAPDGYTFLVMSNTHTVNETLIPKKPFQLMKDFAPVTPINYSDLLLVVHPSVPANNLAELIALAKSQPGKMNYASSGPGTPYHMADELFKSMAGIDVVHVPYKGSDGARVGILGGQVQMMFDAITTMAPNVRAGKLKGFGTSGRARSSVLPETPTVAEAGVPGYESLAWYVMLAPAGTPPAIVAQLNKEIVSALNTQSVKDRLQNEGLETVASTPEEVTAYLRSEGAKWAKVIKAAGIQPH